METANWTRGDAGALYRRNPNKHQAIEIISDIMTGSNKTLARQMLTEMGYAVPEPKPKQKRRAKPTTVDYAEIERLYGLGYSDPEIIREMNGKVSQTSVRKWRAKNGKPRHKKSRKET